MRTGQEPTVWATPTLSAGPRYAATPTLSAGPRYAAMSPPGAPGPGAAPPPVYQWGPPLPFPPGRRPAPAARPVLPATFPTFPGPGRPGAATGWPPHTPDRRPPRWWWLSVTTAALLGVVVVVTIAIVATAGGFGSHSVAHKTPVPPPSASTVAPLPVAALAELLPGRADFAAAVGTAADAQFTRSERLYLDHIVDQDCVGAVGVGNDDFFQGSGWTAARTESLVPTGDNDRRDRAAWLVVVAYPDAASAQAMYAKTVEAGHSCGGRSINLRDRSDPADYDRFSRVGQPIEDNGTVTVSRADEGSEGWGCELGVTTRNNVVISGSVCGDGNITRGCALARRFGGGESAGRSVRPVQPPTGGGDPVGASVMSGPARCAAAACR